MRVLLTGSAGFIGTAIGEQLGGRREIVRFDLMLDSPPERALLAGQAPARRSRDGGAGLLADLNACLG